jgi:hypothetical protein
MTWANDSCSATNRNCDDIKPAKMRSCIGKNEHSSCFQQYSLLPNAHSVAQFVTADYVSLSLRSHERASMGELKSSYKT